MMKMKVVVMMERSLKMGNNYHLNQTQMKAKTSAKGTYAKSTSISMYMYVTNICMSLSSEGFELDLAE